MFAKMQEIDIADLKSIVTLCSDNEWERTAELCMGWNASYIN